mmetsp:Transcript_84303/g.176438  ORF Transcript_84303/g.176438 Transcript_84303/m.176438 type:complete len:105 (-) Transcript_84303:255-569(-)
MRQRLSATTATAAAAAAAAVPAERPSPCLPSLHRDASAEQTLREGCWRRLIKQQASRLNGGLLMPCTQDTFQPTASAVLASNNSIPCVLQMSSFPAPPSQHRQQ